MTFEDLKTIADMLSAPVIVDSTDSSLVARAKETQNTVVNREDFVRDSRTPDEVLENSLLGYIGEFGVIQLTNGIWNPKTPDFVNFDRDSFGWDILVLNRIKLEIKHQSSEYFTVSHNRYQMLVNNQKYYDLIVTTKNEPIDNKYWKVTPRLLITPKDYIDNTKKSVYNKDNTKYPKMYYDHKSGKAFNLQKEYV